MMADAVKTRASAAARKLSRGLEGSRGSVAASGSNAGHVDATRECPVVLLVCEGGAVISRERNL